MERISGILELREILPSFQTGVNFANAAVANRHVRTFKVNSQSNDKFCMKYMQMGKAHAVKKVSKAISK